MPGLSSGVLLQHDHAHPHTARTTAENIKGLQFECILYPWYSPDLAPIDFYLFGPLKGAFGGKKFDTDDDLKAVVHCWLRSKPQDFLKVLNITLKNCPGTRNADADALCRVPHEPASTSEEELPLLVLARGEDNLAAFQETDYLLRPF